MDPRDNYLEYVLVIRDEFSCYFWLYLTETGTTECAVEALVTWVSPFCSFKTLVTVQGTNFKNVMMEELIRDLQRDQHVTTP